MSAPIMDLAVEAAKAGPYPEHANKREAKLLEAVKEYVDNAPNPGSITLAMLDPGITPSHVVKFAGTFTTAGGDASETITVTGAAATDLVFVTVKTAGAVPVSIVAAAAALNAINVTMSADPDTDHVLQYQVLRAAS